jgi:hypothetical protein
MPVELVYWDSDAFLGWLQAEPGKSELCAGTLKRADQGEVLIFNVGSNDCGSAVDARRANDPPGEG